MPSGIYKIHNIVNNHIYIGCASNLSTRKNQHFSSLRNHKHRNQYLQRAFNFYGEDKFFFDILEQCPINQLLEKEQYWFNLAQSEETTLYNLEKIPTRTALIIPRKYWLGKKRSYEDRQKFISSHLGKPQQRKSNYGCTGVTWNKLTNSYRVRLTLNYKTFNLGHFKNLDEAISARTAALEKLNDRLHS